MPVYCMLISQTWQFMEPNTSQGTESSVKTYTRCGGILVNFTANLLPVEEF